MPIKTIQTDKAPAAIGPYSQAVVANGFLFTAGQIALDPGVEAGRRGRRRGADGAGAAQPRRRARVGRRVVDRRREDDGISHDMRDFPRMNEVYARAMGDARPARSTVQVSGLPRGVLVEIDLDRGDPVLDVVRTLSLDAMSTNKTRAELFRLTSFARCAG